MALTSVANILVQDLGGKIVYCLMEEAVSKGEVIVCKTDGKFAQSDAATHALGVAMEDIAINARGPVWMGKGIVWAYTAASLSVGAGVIAGAAGQFVASALGTNQQSAVIVDDTYVDTNYVQLMIL